MANKKLKLNKDNKLISGVCAGFAEYFDIDVTFIRLLVVILGLFFPWTMMAIYFVTMIILENS